MAISTDQIIMELKQQQTLSNTSAALKEIEQHAVQQQRLVSVLQTTINLDELLSLFSKEINEVVSHSGLSFQYDDLNIDLQHGKRSHHSCEYNLSIENTLLGKVTITRRKRFIENELETIERFLGALLYPLKNALLYLQAIQLAHTDPLTGVLNRSTLHTVFKKEVALTQRQHNDLTLLMLDIDFFKKINDTHGHAAGDKALVALTKSIEDTARESDHIFRLGGEEFAILLNSTDLKGANLLAERLRKAVQKISIDHQQQAFGLTVSIGLSHYQENDTLDTLMQRADGALYQAKESGRNKVISA